MEPATVRNEVEYERWHHWPVNWTAVSVGALAVMAVAMIFALSAVAAGAHHFTAAERLVDIHKVGLRVMAIGVVGSFLAFVTGGWIAGKVAGILHSEPAILHGAIVWLVAVPSIAILSAIGAGGFAGSWFGGLSAQTVADAPFNRPDTLAATATEQPRAAYDAEWTQYRRDVAAWNADTPRVTRNVALCGVSGMLIGLMGAVIGGWMASGEPMSVRYRRPIVTA